MGFSIHLFFDTGDHEPCKPYWRPLFFRWPFFWIRLGHRNKYHHGINHFEGCISLALFATHPNSMFFPMLRFMPMTDPWDRYYVSHMCHKKNKKSTMIDVGEYAEVTSLRMQSYSQNDDWDVQSPPKTRSIYVPLPFSEGYWIPRTIRFHGFVKWKPSLNGINEKTLRKIKGNDPLARGI